MKQNEMPDEYTRQLNDYLKLLKKRDEYARIIPTLSPELRREAEPALSELNKSIDKIEQHLAEEQEIIENQKHSEKKHRAKIDQAAENVWEHMERMFIVAKHRGKGDFFKNFEARVTKSMNAEFKEEFYDRIAIRETYDLADILAEADANVARRKGLKPKSPPMKHPQLQMREAIFEINKTAFETDDFFKKTEAEIQKNTELRDLAIKKLKFLSPTARRKKQPQIDLLSRQLESAKLKLAEYLERCLIEDGKVEIEHPDQEKLDAAFAKAEIARERVFLMYKHSQPHLLEGFTAICTSDYTPEELAAFYERIAKREAEELDEILASLGTIADPNSSGH